MILKKLSAVYEMYIEPYYSEYLANWFAGDNYGENRIAMQKSIAGAVSKSEDYGLQMFLKAALVIKSASAKSGLICIALRYDSSASCNLPRSFNMVPRLELASA